MFMGVFRLAYLDIETQAVLLEGLQAGGFIADDGPKLTIDAVIAKGDMDRVVPIAFVELNVVPTEGLPTLKMNVLQLAPPVTRPPNPGIALDPNPIVPAELSRHRGHGLGVNKAPLPLGVIGWRLDGASLDTRAQATNALRCLSTCQTTGKARPRCTTASRTKQYSSQNSEVPKLKYKHASPQSANAA